MGRKPVIVFDLDLTLIDSAPLFIQMQRNAADLLFEACNVPHDEGSKLIAQYLRDHHDCVRDAFKVHHNIPIEISMGRIFHPDSLNLENLKRWHCLSHFSQNYSYPKYLFTNAPSPYMNAILKQLGQRDYFHQTVATDHLDFHRKPFTEAFERFERLTGLSSKEHCIVFIEDNVDNIKAAQKRGWIGVHLSTYNSSPAAISDPDIPVTPCLSKFLA